MSLQSKAAAFVDGVVGVLSPERAHRRSCYRKAREVFEAYAGATTARPHTGWVGTPGSADADLTRDLWTLRERSRDLQRNDACANAVHRSIVDNVVGSGLAPSAIIDPTEIGFGKGDAAEERAKELGEQAERIFREWAERGASADGRLNFNEIQRQALSQVFWNGDVLAKPLMVEREEPDAEIEMALEMVEGDRCDNPRGITKEKEKVIRFGVQLGPTGRPEGYWIAREHPGETNASIYTTRDFDYFPAKNEAGRPNVIHIYEQLRPGQTRGVPWLAPALTGFKNVSGYVESEFVTARVNACLSLAITTPDAQRGARGMSQGTGADGKREQELSPGGILYLRPGEQAQPIMPGRSVGVFESFLDRAVGFVGSGLGLPYELTSRDFRKTNYSSARAALTEARRTFSALQRWFTAKFCQVIYELVLEEAWLKGLWEAPDFYLYRHALTRSKWIHPTWGMIDPKKEIDAYVTAVDRGFMTLSEVCASISGSDWEEVAQQGAREKKRRDQLGLSPPPPVAPGLNGVAAKNGKPKDKDEDPEEEETDGS